MNGIPATIGELLKIRATRSPDHPAIIYHERGLTLSYSELLKISHRVACALSAQGIAPGERLAVWANNVPEWIYLR